MPLRFNFSYHAKEKQIERRIEDKELKETVIKGSKIIGKDKMKARKGDIVVVFKKQGKEKVFIITVITGIYGDY